jgi:hypothetical protein
MFATYIGVTPGQKDICDITYMEDDMLQFVGGGRLPTFTLAELHPHMSNVTKYDPGSVFKFISHSHQNVAEALYNNSINYVSGCVPLKDFAPKLTMKGIKSIAKIHHIHIPARTCLSDIPLYFRDHHCSLCNTHVSIFKLHTVKTTAERSKTWYSTPFSPNIRV